LTPGLPEFGGGGYGEVPVAALVLWAFVCQAAVIGGSRRPVALMAVGFALVGLALTIKIITGGVLPILLVGLVLALVIRRDVSRWLLALSASTLAVPIVLFEAFRVRQLGSLRNYWDFWRHQSSLVQHQAGLADGSARTDALHKAADHLHLLAQQTGIRAEALVVMIALPGLALLAAFLLRRVPWREWLAAPTRALTVLLVGSGYLYWAWWLVVTPTEKAWLRRILIGLLLMSVAYALLAGAAIERARTVRLDSARTRAVISAAALVGVVAVGFLAWSAATTARHTFRTFASPSDDTQQAITVAVDHAEELEGDGATLFGGGWWSAPVVSLFADAPLEDLTQLDACSPEDQTLLASGKAILVWDWYAMRIVGPTPHQNGFEFVPLGTPSSYAGFWQLRFAPGACAAA
jgi:hypothetical protein